MKKFFEMFIPVVIIILSILIMLSGSFLKKPLLGWDNIPMSLDSITNDVIADNWQTAEQDTLKLEKAWKTMNKRIQFSCERDEMHAFSVAVSRLKAAVTTNDKTSTLMEVNEAKQHWQDLGR